LRNFGYHPVVFAVAPVNHVVLTLFCFPTAAQHVTAHATFKIAKITKSIIPTHRFMVVYPSASVLDIASSYLCANNLIKIATINIGVQQFVVAYITLGQGFTPSYASHTTHVFTVPVLSKVMECNDLFQSWYLYTVQNFVQVLLAQHKRRSVCGLR
jgi:hypothetical protein